jgi:hypothetical protein
MGVLGLAIVWTTALLLAGAALYNLADLRRLKRALRGVTEATVVTGNGHNGAFAVQRVEQVGRALDVSGGRGIAFFDRSFGSEVFGGSLDVDGRTVDVVPTLDVSVWPSTEAQVRRALDDSEFDAAFDLAKTARGFARVVETPLRAGDKVWVTAELAQRELALSKGSIVSAIDPHAWVARKMGLVWLFIAAEVLVAAACTAVALVRPWFGPVSSIGGVLCLAYFLAIQPFGNAVRDAVRTPSHAFLRGVWKRQRDVATV